MLVLLYEFPAETRLTVYRRLDILKELYVRLRTDPSPYSKVFIVKGKGVNPASRTDLP